MDQFQTAGSDGSGHKQGVGGPGRRQAGRRSDRGRRPTRQRVLVEDRGHRLAADRGPVGNLHGRSAAVAERSPLAHGPAVLALYVPWTLAEKVAGVPAKIDFAGVVLAKGIKVGEFRAQWAERLKQASPPIEFQAQEDVGAQLDQSWTSETSADRRFPPPASRCWLRSSLSSRRSTWAWTNASASSPCCGPSR